MPFAGAAGSSTAVADCSRSTRGQLARCCFRSKASRGVLATQQQDPLWRALLVIVAILTRARCKRGPNASNLPELLVLDGGAKGVHDRLVDPHLSELRRRISQ